MTTSAFGRFLEYSVPTQDVQESLHFYHKLGFTELPVGDVRNYHYAVVTDGRIAIGLHAGGIEEPTLTFVRPDLLHHVRALEEAGQTFEFVELDAEIFNEIGLRSPDGLAVRIIEARTFSGTGDGAPIPVIGRAAELILCSNDLRASFSFWQIAGFIADEDATENEYTERITLRSPGAVLGLRGNQRHNEPVPRFVTEQIDATLEQIERLEIDYRRHSEAWAVTAPEGTHILICESPQ